MGFYLHNAYLALNLFVFRLAKFFVQVIGARLLAAAAFGQFSYIYSLIDIWNHVFGAGLDVIGARMYQTSPRWPVLWRQTIALKFLLALAGVAAGFFVLDWPYAVLFGLWHLFFMQGKLAYSFLNTLLYPKGLVIGGFLAEVTLLFSAYLGLRFWGLPGFLFAFAAERAVEATVFWLILRKREPELAAGQNLLEVKEVLRDHLIPAWPVWAAQLLGVLVSRFDTVLIAHLLDFAKTGLYGVAQRCVEAPLFVFAAAADSSLAYFIRHPSERSLRYRQSMKMTILLAAGFSVFLVGFGLWGVPFVFGTKYQAADFLIAAYAWVLIPRAVNMVSTSRLLSEHQEKLILASSLAGLSFSVVANVAFIPVWGLAAAAMTAVASESLIMMMRAWFIKEGRCKAMAASVVVLAASYYWASRL
ncbi:MAG: polysaccharide biosynthesis C-terminal domain-containing protein [Elusimicrobia bacterium]|nr:polysaccharide biosynthesis C-terminal domain-containing protein [Elusimicrobiota bacterium]